jgi:hypothetical protein
MTYVRARWLLSLYLNWRAWSNPCVSARLGMAPRALEGWPGWTGFAPRYRYRSMTPLDRVNSLPLRGGFCGEPRSMTFGVRRRLFVIACCALGLVVAGIDVALIYLSFRRPSPVNAGLLLRSSLFIRQSGDASNDGLIGV